MRHIALLGSTGSIGTNTLEVIARNRDRFTLAGIAAGENIPLLKQQVDAFNPQVISVKEKSDADQLSSVFPDKDIYYGGNGLMEVVSHPQTDTIVSAIDGTTALEATMESIRRGHRVCLANKETLVAAGELINNALGQSGSQLIPIDSEQSAIFQALGNNSKEFIHKIILTASGGPFFRKKKEEFHSITIKQALAHPTWSMGTKVTIDSATLMNKALEVIEAFYLFQVNHGQVDVVIHPQSIVHSMVEYVDASIIAQLSVPDMKLPILYSLSYPERVPFEQSRMDFSVMQKLEFYPVDTETFTSIKMAYRALEQGKNAGAVLNAANEVAVEYFLKETISFSDIFSVVEHIFYNENFYPLHSVGDVNETTHETKQKTREYINKNTTVIGVSGQGETR